MFLTKFVLWTLFFGALVVVLSFGLDFLNGKPFLYWTTMSVYTPIIALLAIAGGLWMSTSKPKAG